MSPSGNGTRSGPMAGSRCGWRKELVRWVLSWIPDVKVLAPKSLRDRIVEKLQDGLRRQDEASGPNQTLHTNREQARGR